ncbi:SOUL family heme-binding protein [Natrarchaeobaculum sulfurireducens]|uniref:SOUL heme-binding protein n=1 Tax=Natrarchaeobaculum sulfurireducens TaxID=2044521 RepID=A0A346P9P1_9EURY|nr:heme-binding protein [Natrarchaeobaculum sulfurireducens]AXR76236.1 SOUL heme-binding protein [Natrarchaeobaculum sulfurireducens]
MRLLTKAAILGSGVALAGWIGWGLYSTRGTKTVPYERLRTLDGGELRQYPQTVLVETSAPNQRIAFRRLFNYISGANQRDESIPMTAPVETQSEDSIPMTAPVRSAVTNTDADSVRMAFYLPAEYSPETAPEPTEAHVSLVTEPRKAVAVDQFSWWTPEWRVARRTRKLLSTLDREGMEPQGDPYLLRYNDPWTPPFMRRNEIAVEVLPT